MGVLLKLATFVSPKVVTALFQIEKVDDVFVYRSRQCRVIVTNETETVCESCKEIFDALILNDGPNANPTNKLKEENETDVKEDKNDYAVITEDDFDMSIKEEDDRED